MREFENSLGRVIGFFYIYHQTFYSFSCVHTVPVEAAKNIKASVFSSVQIHTQDGRKDEQHHGKIEHHHHSGLQERNGYKTHG